MKTIKILKRLFLVLAVIMATTMSADAQFKGLGKKLKNAGKNTIERNINSAIGHGERAVDRSLDKAADATVDAVNKKVQSKKNKKGAANENGTVTTDGQGNATGNAAQKADNADLSTSGQVDEYTRVIPEDQWNPQTFYSTDVRPIEHADWNSSTSMGRLKEHLSFLMAKQLEYINSGNWDGVASGFKTRNIDMLKVIQEMQNRKEDVWYEIKQVNEITKTQRDVLYPGLHVCDRTGYSLEWQTGNYDFSIQMTKYRFYDILKYYIEMAKRETSDVLRYTTTCEVIYWRADGVMHPEMFKEDPIFGDDEDWVAADKELTELCKATGIKGFQSFENITAYRKKLEAEAMAKEAEWNTANRIPKNSLNDPNAIAFAKKEFPNIMGTDKTIVKVYVKSKWNVATNAFGVPINREKTMTVIAKHPDGYYRLHDCRMSSITSNGGRSWSNPMFSIDAVAGNREGYVVNWK